VKFSKLFGFGKQPGCNEVTKFNRIEFELRKQARRAEYMDVFCKSGFFSYWLHPRITFHFIRATMLRAKRGLSPLKFAEAFAFGRENPTGTSDLVMSSPDGESGRPVGKGEC